MAKKEPKISSIDKQIAELQAKKLEIEALKAFVKAGSAIFKDDKYKDLKNYMLKNINSYIESQIESIESTGTISSIKKENNIEKQDLEFLKELRKRAQKVTGEKLKKEPPSPPDNTKNLDPLKFLTTFRHLENKKVIVNTQDGDVIATVIGLNHPNIRVLTETNYRVDIDPSKIKEIK